MLSDHSGQGVPPSVVAARRSRHSDAAAAGRPYPAAVAADDREAVAAQLAATRALLTATTPQHVVAVVAALVRDLGGGLVPARLAQPHETLQIDVSFGLSEPLLPWADPVSVAWMRLSRELPGFVTDARLVFDRLQGEARRGDEAERDSLTGLLTRRAWMRRLSEAVAGDAVCVLDLDHFKAANDAAGHAGGDEVLREVAGLLMRVFRPTDACGRYGGDELVCLSPGMPAEAMAGRLDVLRSLWKQERPAAGAGVGLSVGVAQIGDRQPRLALRAADTALYRVKAGGRDATAVATAEDVDAVVSA
jgi:diguanylate cyclase (GGDEF)-like protein